MKGTLKEDYITKGVTFNQKDPDQAKLLEYALERPNFSGYIKRLIQRDMESQPQAKEKPLAVRTAGGGVKIDLRN